MPKDRVQRLLVPYHHAEPLAALAAVFPADDTVVTVKGPHGAMLERLYVTVAKRVAACSDTVVVASGDCTTALATVAGLQGRGLDPGVIWLDAHADFHTPKTTTSGYFGGMALAMLTGRAGASFCAAIGLRAVDERACVLAGARAIDDGERANLAGSAVRVVTLDELDALDDLPPRPWYVHLDIDLADPAELPALRFPEPGGPPLERVAAAVRRLADRGPIAALGLALTCPPAAFVAAAPFGPIVSALTGALAGSSPPGDPPTT